MDEKPKKRWLQFSVRTMLIVVTIFCTWLAWQVSIVQERKAVVRLLDHRAGAVSFSAFVDPPYVNIARRMLDDVPPLYSLHIYDATPEEIQRIQSAFPEVVDFRVTQTPGGS